jgi:hypothetical protein
MSKKGTINEGPIKRCVLCNLWNLWCIGCHTNYLKKNFKNWTSGNKKIDGFIREKQLNINRGTDIIFEWIPYNSLNDIKGIGKDDIIYSAIWKDGQLKCDKFPKGYIREPNKKVSLKCIGDQKILYKVCEFNLFYIYRIY